MKIGFIGLGRMGAAMASNLVKAGIDRQAYVELLTSTIFTAPDYKTYGALLAQGRIEPAGFAAPLGCKDIRLALAATEDLRVPMPLGSLLHDRFLRLLAQGGEEGIAIIPSFGVPACRSRNVVTSQLINPVARFDFHMISRRGSEVPPGADEFSSFLKSYIATWAGRAGVL